MREQAGRTGARAGRRARREHARREFDAYVRDVAPRLTRTALLLTGDPARAARRVDVALTRAWLTWRRPGADPAREVYRVLGGGYLTRWRRPAAARDGDPVLAALDRLTRLERAAVVLCGHARLDTYDAADALGVRPGAVDAAYARALGVLGRPEAYEWSASPERPPSPEWSASPEWPASPEWSASPASATAWPGTRAATARRPARGRGAGGVSGGDAR